MILRNYLFPIGGFRFWLTTFWFYASSWTLFHHDGLSQRKVTRMIANVEKNRQISKTYRTEICFRWSWTTLGFGPTRPHQPYPPIDGFSLIQIRRPTISSKNMITEKDVAWYNDFCLCSFVYVFLVNNTRGLNVCTVREGGCMLALNFLYYPRFWHECTTEYKKCIILMPKDDEDSDLRFLKISDNYPRISDTSLVSEN